MHDEHREPEPLAMASWRCDPNWRRMREPISIEWVECICGRYWDGLEWDRYPEEECDQCGRVIGPTVAASRPEDPDPDPNGLLHGHCP